MRFTCMQTLVPYNGSIYHFLVFSVCIGIQHQYTFVRVILAQTTSDQYNDANS